MKSIFGILIIFLSLSVYGENEVSPGKEYGEPIIIEIIKDNLVKVNGVEVSVKKSWMEANNYIDPHKINVYKILNSSKYIAQSEEIAKNMAIVAETAGVEIERER